MNEHSELKKMIKDLIKQKKIKNKYEVIIEIYPHKFTNTIALNAFLVKLKQEYNIYKLTNTWIRAFKK